MIQFDLYCLASIEGSFLSSGSMGTMMMSAMNSTTESVKNQKVLKSVQEEAYEDVQ